MRTLIILKGQLRTWHESKEFLKSYIIEMVNNAKLANSEEIFFAGAQIDILISCWDISYQLYKEPNEISYLKKETAAIDDFRAFFSDTGIVRRVFFEMHGFLETQQYFDKIGLSLDEEYHFPCYLTYRTGLKKRRIEAEGDFNYDYVIELRPDVMYDFKTGSKTIRKPGFGEIQSLHGNEIRDIHGIFSPITDDLIFFMSGRTYDLYSKEILFHYQNIKKKKPYTTAHIEKSLFFMSHNIQVNDMLHALCSVAVILRPTIDWNHLSSLQQPIEIMKYVRHIDSCWRTEKDLALNRLLAQDLHLEALVENETKIKQENLQKIKDLF